MARIILTGSVGRNADNREADVGVVRHRLRDLGFNWIGATGTGETPSLIRTIRLFQAITEGDAHFHNGRGHDGVISPGGRTHRWLAAENAPRWVRVHGMRGPGWRTTELPPGVTGGAGGTPYIVSNGGWGTSWIVDMLNAAGRAYQQRVAATVDCVPTGAYGMAANRAMMAEAPFANFFFCEPEPLRHPMPPMWVRDCAPEQAGNARFHGSHETGLDVDIRLPLNDWAETATASGVPWRYLGTQRDRRRHFNRAAARLQLESLSEQPAVQVIGFEDDSFSRREDRLHRISKVQTWDNHKDHFHVRIVPPARVAGQIA